MKAYQQSSSTVQTATCIARRYACALHHGLRRSLRCLLLFITVMLAANFSHAGALQVEVHGHDGKSLSNVVVMVNTQHGHVSGNPHKDLDARGYVMDQVNLRFVPQVLVVPVNASVSFPNSDTVSHQVYSFSNAKRFQLPLYKGEKHRPVIFDKPGLVVLGCNIHDDMIGYIYVTDAPWFGQTNDDGSLTIPDVNNGPVTVSIWSPIIADDAKSLTKIMVVSDKDSHVVFTLNKSLRSSPEPRPRNPDWDY